MVDQGREVNFGQKTFLPISVDNLSISKELNVIDPNLDPHKGQLISECLFDILNFPKKTTKKFDKFLT